MKIQEHMVKILNEESWNNVALNYLESSSKPTLKDFYLAFKKIC